MTDKDTIEEPKVDKHTFYFELPLYKQVIWENVSENLFEEDVDAYINNIDTTYSIEKDSIDTWQYQSQKLKRLISIGFYLITLRCKRKKNPTLRFFVYKDDTCVEKIGMEPSLADIQFAEIGKKYDRVLSKEHLTNLKKAIGLASHGAGAGSFVYLRRIFEDLILEAFNKNATSLEVKLGEFISLRMADKIEILKEFLPSQLIAMKGIYSILSKGVHELSEEECLKYFPAIKLSIVLILEEKIEQKLKADRDKTVKDQLASILAAEKK